MYIIGHLINSPAFINFTGNLKARIYDNIIPHFFFVMSGVAIKLMLDYIRMQQKYGGDGKGKSRSRIEFLNRRSIHTFFLIP